MKKDKGTKHLLGFANMVLNHHKKEEVLDRILTKLFVQFKQSNLEDRNEISRQVDSINFFFDELEYIVDDNIVIEEEEEDKDNG